MTSIDILLEPDAGTVLRDFVHSNAGVTAIVGPVGSGKSTACIARLIRHSIEQTVGWGGKREVKWFCMRSTYRELWETTIETWSRIFPRTKGSWTGAKGDPAVHRLTLRPRSGGTVSLQMSFAALSDDYESMLRGLEVTGFWLNEADKLPSRVFELCMSRAGRFPKTVSEGGSVVSGPVWSGVIMDLNAADDLNWIHALVNGPSCTTFIQPPGVWRDGEGDGDPVLSKDGTLWRLNARAENLANLPRDYYRNQVMTISDREIVRMLRNLPAPPMGSRAVFARSWKPEFHVARNLVARPGLPLLIGADAGRTPRAVVGQVMDDGQGVILDEFGADDCSARDFGTMLRRAVEKRWPQHRVEAYADPAANNPSEASDISWMQLMSHATGWRWIPAPGRNLLEERLEAVDAMLRNHPAPGQPGLIVNEKCKMIRSAMQTGYRYNKVRGGDDDRWGERPLKNDASHIADALQYWCLGAGAADLSFDRKRRIRNQTRQLPRQSVTVDQVVRRPGRQQTVEEEFYNGGSFRGW